MTHFEVVKCRGLVFAFLLGLGEGGGSHYCGCGVREGGGRKLEN